MQRTTVTKFICLCVCVCVCVCVKIFHFKKLLRSVGKTGVKEMKLKFSELKEFMRPVQNALGVLPATLKVWYAKTDKFHLFMNCLICVHF